MKLSGHRNSEWDFEFATINRVKPIFVPDRVEGEVNDVDAR